MDEPTERGAPVTTGTEALDSFRALSLVFGIAMIVFGIMAIVAPVAASFATTYLVGAMLLAGAAVRFVHAIEEREAAGLAWPLISAVLYAVAGVLVIAYPFTAVVTLTLMLGTFFVVTGFLKAARALRYRYRPHRGWLLFDGIVTLVLGILLWAQLPVSALWALGLIVGIDLIVGGVTVIGVSRTARRAIVGP